MPPAYDPSKVLLPSDGRARAIDLTLMFGRRTIWSVYVGANALGVALVLWSFSDHTALLTPVGPNFRAVVIGLGVFLGVLVAAVEREAWLLGFGGRRAPRGFAVWIAMFALVAASGFGGDFMARKLWEWQAFRSAPAATVDRMFTVVARRSARSGDSLQLRSEFQAPPFPIACSHAMYLATQIGDRLILTIETGRGSAQRVRLPPLRDVRRG